MSRRPLATQPWLWTSAWFGILLAGGCNAEGGTAPAARQSSSPTSPASADPSSSRAAGAQGSAAAGSAAASGANGQPPAPAALPAIPKPPDEPSPKPPGAGWSLATPVQVDHAESLGCWARVLREWLRVECHANPRNGLQAPSKTEVTRRPEAEKTLYTDVGVVVVALRPPVSAAVELSWTQVGSRTLTIDYPAAAAPPKVSFDRGGPPNDAPYPPAGLGGKDDMVQVPGGKGPGGESVGPVWVDRTETTVAAYRQCVRAKGCTAMGGSCKDGSVHQSPSLPVNCVSFEQAEAYCQWAGKRLPTAAEWRFAALGSDGRKLPWGDQLFTSHLCCKSSQTVAKATRHVWSCDVGTYPAGQSPFGLLDAAGNVAEWTSSSEGEGKTVLGGYAKRSAFSWESFWKSWTMVVAADEQRPHIGFRCVRGSEGGTPAPK